MKNKELLKNEKLERVLSPHPLSFMRFQALCIYLLIWGILFFWLINVSEWHGTFTGNFWLSLSLWGIGLLLAGIVVSLISVRWSIFILYGGVFISGTVIIFWFALQESISVFAPIYTIFMSILGFLMVEAYRRSHKYIISNQRIIFKGGIITKEERTLRYDKITDINAKQGIMGQIFGFGTIIPISQSGFGLGSDKSMAGGGAMLGGKKAKVFGIFGGGKEVQTPRSRTYYELHGVYPYKEVKKLVEEMVQGNVITPYQQEQVAFQKEQVDIQKQMRDLLKMQTNVTGKQKVSHDKNSDKDKDEEVEVFEPEQKDIQQQMRDLLKMQTGPEDEEEEDEEEDEENKA